MLVAVASCLTKKKKVKAFFGEDEAAHPTDHKRCVAGCKADETTNSTMRHLLVLLAIAAAARQSDWPVAGAQVFPPPPARSGSERFAWLFGGDGTGGNPNPIVCEESFDATLSAGINGAARCSVITGSLIVSGGLPGWGCASVTHSSRAAGLFPTLASDDDEV